MIQSALGISAASALPASLLSLQTKAEAPRQVIDETPKLAFNVPDSVGDSVIQFFDRDGFSALRRLGEILVPARQSTPGAIEAEAAEFLDFLIGQSPSDRQALYRDGVAQLNREARERYGKPFADLSGSEADTILAPLREAWTYNGPADPFARFLRSVKEDFLQATVNSRQWASALAKRSRSASGLNTYWFPIE
jgi:hypothetical protein